MRGLYQSNLTITRDRVMGTPPDPFHTPIITPPAPQPPQPQQQPIEGIGVKLAHNQICNPYARSAVGTVVTLLGVGFIGVLGYTVFSMIQADREFDREWKASRRR